MLNFFWFCKTAITIKLIYLTKLFSYTTHVSYQIGTLLSQIMDNTCKRDWQHGCIVTICQSSFWSHGLLCNVHTYPIHICIATQLDGWQRGANSTYHDLTMLAASTLVIPVLHYSNTEHCNIRQQFCTLQFNDMRRLPIMEQYYWILTNYKMVF